MQTLNLRIKERSRITPTIIGCVLWEEALPAFLKAKFSHHSLFVITDSNVFKIYGERVKLVLKKHQGFKKMLVFPAGEEQKTREEKARLEDELLAEKAGRDTVLLAMGGGVTGDLCGFIAASLHRGVPVIQVPTSLLAQVDSSIGGKTGVNHPAGINLIGAFHQPAAVFIDVDFLRTLPVEEYLNGMAEVIKIGVIFDKNFFQLLETEHEKILSRDPEILQQLITTCVELKIEVVEEDVEETGYRSVLNFGHTVGHAIERLSQYTIRHGYAVAAGMKVAAQLSHQILGYSKMHVNALSELLKIYDLNRVDLKAFSPEILWETMRLDKKARNQEPRFTLLKNTAEVQLFYPVCKKDFENALRSA
jgi:3-dehydroquinate synthase